MWKWNDNAKQYQCDVGNEFLCLHKRRGTIRLEYFTSDEQWNYQNSLSLDLSSQRIEINGRKYFSDGRNMQKTEATPNNFLKHRQVYTEGEGLPDNFKEFSLKVFDGLDQLVN